MTIHRLRVVPLIVYFCFLSVTTGCHRHNPTYDKLDTAENIMESRPDSALAILNDIPSSDLNGKEVKARYALLTSIALDKNAIDTTTFDILQPAIDYYLKYGSPDEKLRTYYYQGRIFQNQPDFDSAMVPFIKAVELKDEVTDSLTLARSFVAQGTIYSQIYKGEEFTHNNLEAAKIYGALGKRLLEIRSYAKAAHGCVLTENKERADSLLAVCDSLVKKYKIGEDRFFSSTLSYKIEFGSNEDLRIFLNESNGRKLSHDDSLDFVRGYMKIGDYEKSMDYISTPCGGILDSLKYTAVKAELFEKMGDFEEAYKCFNEYVALFDRHVNYLIKKDIVFAEKKHSLELENLVAERRNERNIWIGVTTALLLLLLLAWLYFTLRINASRRAIAEKENENLKKEKDELNDENEKIKLERDNVIIERDNVIKEANNLKKEKESLKAERDNLKDLLNKRSELDKSVREAIRHRFEMLNSLLAKEITNNENLSKPFNKWIESIRKNKVEFMNSTRLSFMVSHPKFMDHLISHELSVDEINYICLYAIGLRGKEAGDYINLKRHYNVSSQIRKKLGIDQHETNLGPYIRRLMQDSDPLL